MRLPERFAKQQERTQYKNRFADWNLRIAAYCEGGHPADAQRSLEALLREGVDLLNEMMEGDHKDLLESYPIELGNTYAEEFRMCLTDFVKKSGQMTEQMSGDSVDTGDLIAEVYDALEGLDSYLKS